MNKRLVVAAYAFTIGIVVAAQAATTLTVSQHGMALSKTSATISRGDKIVFTNGVMDGDNTIADLQILTGDPGTNSLETLMSILH